MTDRSGGKPRQPVPPRRRGGVFIWALVAAVVIVGGLAFFTRGGDDEATPKSNIVQQLKDAGYKKVGDRKHDSAEAGRKVTDQTWQRAAPPEMITISDDSPYTTEGVFVVNAVTFTGTDGKGVLRCQPDPEHERSPVKEIVDNALLVRAGIADKSLQADPEDSGGFPYREELVGCTT